MYRVHTDGACRGNPGPAALGVSIRDESGREVATASEVIGRATNNVAEYRALIRALELLEDLGAAAAEFRLDSELIVRQLEGRYKVRDAKMKRLFSEVTARLQRLDAYTVHHVPRAENARADALANLALDREAEAP
jgi:ribonuclease HI